MYFRKKGMIRAVKMEPMFLGPNFQRHVESKLKADVEGKCDDSGYYLCVSSIDRVEKGRCQDGTGMIVVNVEFSVLVYKAITYEIVDAVVTTVNNNGIFCKCGPQELFLSYQNMDGSWRFIDGASPRFENDDSAAVITLDSEIKVQIQKSVVNNNTLSGVGKLVSLTEEY